MQKHGENAGYLKMQKNENRKINIQGILLSEMRGKYVLYVLCFYQQKHFTFVCALLFQASPMEQAELVPGSGVYVTQVCQKAVNYIDKGTKLVRRLMREVFPDAHMLANSSCLASGRLVGLDEHKVEVIKGR